MTLDNSALNSFFQPRLSGNFQPLAHEDEADIEAREAVNVRALFVSDMHLGTRFCKADHILSFLRKYEAETLYLIGDVIDGWRLKKSWYWPESHEEVLRAIMDKAANGSRVVYLSGNHDDFLRNCEKKPTGVEVAETAIHTTAEGKRYLLMHGDRLDGVTHKIPWLAHAGDVAYDVVAAFSFVYNKFTGLFGFEYRSIAAWAKSNVKRVVNFLSKFDDALVTLARDNDVDGVICGHVHHAVIRNIGKICYVNTGDWVDNCTAIAENACGALELIRHRTNQNVKRAVRHGLKTSTQPADTLS